MSPEYLFKWEKTNECPSCPVQFRWLPWSFLLAHLFNHDPGTCGTLSDKSLIRFPNRMGLCSFVSMNTSTIPTKNKNKVVVFQNRSRPSRITQTPWRCHLSCLQSKTSKPKARTLNVGRNKGWEGSLVCILHIHLVPSVVHGLSTSLLHPAASENFSEKRPRAAQAGCEPRHTSAESQLPLPLEAPSATYIIHFYMLSNLCFLNKILNTPHNCVCPKVHFLRWQLSWYNNIYSFHSWVV